RDRRGHRLAARAHRLLRAPRMGDAVPDLARGGPPPGPAPAADPRPDRRGRPRLAPRCTHFDAFRFFTDPAAPLNQTRLTRDDQVRHEQPACLHAGMDVYSWVTKMEAGAP